MKKNLVSDLSLTHFDPKLEIILVRLFEDGATKPAVHVDFTGGWFAL